MPRSQPVEREGKENGQNDQQDNPDQVIGCDFLLDHMTPLPFSGGPDPYLADRTAMIMAGGQRPWHWHSHSHRA